ncbi:MAG: MBOAT family O-acyltransferase [Pseudomonadota bacterium]
MIVDFFVLLWTLAFAVPLYWATPAGFVATRLAVVLAVSAIFLWLLSPAILVTVAAYAAVVAGFAAWRRAGADAAAVKRASWAVFAPLLFAGWIPQDALAAGLLGQSALTVQGLAGFALLGLSYTAIRSFLLIRQGVEARAPKPMEAAAALLFFGSFVAGPIANALPWRNASARLEGRDALEGIARIGWGAALFLIARPVVQDADVAGALGLAADGTAAAWVGVFQNFLALYIDFTGYTDVAIGCGLLFGVRLPENFNWPLRATSIQEFWRRWHMSLGAFIGAYLFKPLVRKTGRPMLAIFSAFVFVGLWHKVSLPYLVWGVGHGAALAANMAWSRRNPTAGFGPVGKAGAAAIGWAATMTLVATLSAFANAGGAADAAALAAKLTGAG